MLAPKGLQASGRTARSKPDVQWILEVESPRQPELLNGKKFDLTPQLNLRDPQVVRSVQLLQTEVEKGSNGKSFWRDDRQFTDRLSGSALLNGSAWSGPDPRRTTGARAEASTRVHRRKPFPRYPPA